MGKSVIEMTPKDLLDITCITLGLAVFDTNDLTGTN